MAAGSGLLKEREITPVIQAGAYSAGQVVFVPTELRNILRHMRRPNAKNPTSQDDQGNNVAINSITMLDDGDLAAIDMDLIFLRSDPASFGVVGAALGLTDADAVEVIAVVNLETTADASDLLQTMFYQKEGLAIQAQGDSSVTTSIWVGAVARAAFTPTAVDDFHLRIGVTQD